VGLGEGPLRYQMKPCIDPGVVVLSPTGVSAFRPPGLPRHTPAHRRQRPCTRGQQACDTSPHTLEITKVIEARSAQPPAVAPRRGQRR